ncbi:two-component regulator propeller domain-containing protein [Marinilabilia salmonicolor]|uniref:Putative secreted protein (Por secretion system target) n=1 Tax=Marinilabilia salmonicolor TaxID=989 RepID=A0A368UV77_9BACT|nr:two-component regulator propeller domain-containing protein [Marinilabilia salmonicolor]RCW31985.1 putative secreted protein (Por secretion system target) [Marinilabilia salmonicolor]
MKQIFYFLILSFLLGLPTKAGGAEQWKTYYSYRNCFDVVESSEFFIGATRLGLIYFHKETSSVSIKNKNNGLSDSGISAIMANPGNNTVLLGYENGNMDIIMDGKVFNIPDLKIENLSTSKQINHFLSYNNRVFVSTDFGILELDIEKKEIATTLIIGSDASFLKVSKTAIKEDSIFAATEKGLLAANINLDQLAFYQNWKRISQSENSFCDVASTTDAILGIRGEKGATCNLISFSSAGQTTIGSFARFYNLFATEEETFLASRDRVTVFNESLEVTTRIDSIEISPGEYHHPSFKKALKGSNNQIWFADWEGGLYFQKTGTLYEQLLPAGPASNNIYDVVKTKDALWTVPGGFGALFENIWRAPEVSVLNNDQWTIFNRSNTEVFKSSNSRDLINISVNPENHNNVFIASWGNGFYEFDKNADGTYYLKNHFVEDNSGLHNFPSTPMDRYTRVWAMEFDRNGNMFITNSEVDEQIVVYNPEDNKWIYYNYGTLATDWNKTADILIDDYNQKWVYVVHGPARGLFVFDDNGTPMNESDDRYRGVIDPSADPDPRNAGLMELWDENGESLTNYVYCFAKDKNGYIWIGTDLGVLVQYDPGNIFNKEKPVFSRIKVPRNDGTGLADYLLEGQRVTAIAVDGANRKYIGTEGTGLYIISEDGLKTVEHYTKTNSPLPSDNISNIYIDEESGEVFIATNEGLISLLGEATQGENNFSNVYVYPNPVRPHHQGNITIAGLMDRTTVKITDTAGNLVYETLSLGGQALWNGQNLHGEKVKPGIYIVFLSTPNGSMSEFTKIAFVR